MSKEERATAVAKEIVEEIGKDAAAALVEYANLVKQLAADLTEERKGKSGRTKIQKKRTANRGRSKQHS